MDVGVYGLGRFGSFWAAQLAQRFTVGAWSRSAHPAPAGVALVSEAEVLAAPVIVLCVAISALDEVAARIAPQVAPDALVMDTCSIKVHAAQVLAARMPASTRILATHPMFGPDSARNGITGHPMILCPVRTPEREVAKWRASFEQMGLRVLTMSAEEHDREAAFTQGVAHYLGRMLAEMDLRASSIATVGYQKLLEIVEQTCNDSMQLFVDLQTYNPYTREMRAKLEGALATVRRRLDEQHASLDGARAAERGAQETEQTPPGSADAQRRST